MVINTFSRQRLRNATHITVMRNFVTYLNDLASVIDNRLRDKIVVLVSCIDREDDDYIVSQASDLSDVINKADYTRDRAYGTICNVARAFAVGYGSERQTEAAKSIVAVCESHKVVVTAQKVQETGMLNEFLQHTASLADAFAALALTDVYARLKESNDIVNNCIMSRQDERAERMVGALKADRAATDAAYVDVVNYLVAISTVLPSPAYDAFAKKWNSYVDYVRKQIVDEGAAPATPAPSVPEQGTTTGGNGTTTAPEGTTQPGTSGSGSNSNDREGNEYEP